MTDTFTIEYSGLTQLTIRTGQVSNRLMAAIEAEMRRQIPLMAAKVRGNIGSSFNNPTRMQSAVGTKIERKGNTVSGTVDASGGITGVALPFMGIQESGGVTAPHDIFPTNNALHFFGRSGDEIFAKVIHHPGSTIPAHHFVKRAFDDRKRDLINAFAQVLGATVRQTLASATP